MDLALNNLQRLICHKTYQTKLAWRCRRLSTNGWQRWFTGNVQEIKMWTYLQMVYAQIRICPRKWDTLNFLILRYKQITQTQPESQTYCKLTEKKEYSEESWRPISDTRKKEYSEESWRPEDTYSHSHSSK